MRKVAVLLLSLALAFTGFACGGDSGGTTSDQGDPRVRLSGNDDNDLYIRR